MPLMAQITIDHPAPGVAVVAIKGDLDAYSAPDLRDTYVDLINQARFRQVFDLSAVTRIDSTGLGVIVGALKNLRARGGDLALVVPREAADVQHALAITGLAKTIPHAETIEGALGLIAPKPEPRPEDEPPMPTPSVVDLAGAIVDLQTEIQIATCRSCGGHRTQARVLEPYASAPCLRCHGEGVTHEVPPGRYDAALSALLDALAGAPVDQVVRRLAPLVVEFNPATT